MKGDICIGCGVCVAACPESNLSMKFADEGLYKPVGGGECLGRCGRCARVCPFGETDEDEDTLADMLFGGLDGISRTKEAGFHLSTYIGSADETMRLAGASGGMATWVACQLLDSGHVDKVITVTSGGAHAKFFKFEATSDPAEVRKAAGSAYYPVDLSDALAELRKVEGRYAIVGLPCFVKAIRLAQTRDKVLADRIKVCLGIVCGHLKTAWFADYLIALAGGAPDRTRRIFFREKVPSGAANGYRFACEGTYGIKRLARDQGYSEVQRSGEFKPEACGYCDDVFAETADAAFMDAWLPEYLPDWRGTSIVVVRSPVIRDIIMDGISGGLIQAKSSTIDKALESQAGVIGEKRDKLAKRLWMAEKWGVTPPRKRVSPVKPSWGEKVLLDAQERLRAASNHEFAASCGSIASYRKAMGGHFSTVRRAKRISRLLEKIGKLLGAGR